MKIKTQPRPNAEALPPLLDPEAEEKRLASINKRIKADNELKDKEKKLAAELDLTQVKEVILNE